MNTTIHILQAAATYATLAMVKPIELPHPPKYSMDYKELLNFISKVHSKLARESSYYIDNQYKLYYIDGFLNGNIQNQIQPYILPNKINLQNVERLISILEATFGDPNQVGMASVELAKLTHRNKEFSQYYVEFQYLMAILDHDSNVKKATLKHGLS
jgi:hypothetical protein